MKLFFFLLSFSFHSLACDGGLNYGKIISIPEQSFLANDLTEPQFKKLVKDFEIFFRTEVDRDHNRELQLYGAWKTNTVNAFAEQTDGRMMITIYGGLARHKSMTPDGVTLTLCHELGHHLGGYPKKSTNKWSSAEGQADYYATMKCGRKIWEKENNESVVAQLTVPETVTRECAISYSSNSDRALCVRMSLAGRALALLFQDLESDSIEPKFETPSDLVVRNLNYMHPYNQCRLDTYFQGSLCPVSKDIAFDNEDEVKGSCHPKLSDVRGLRPRCWFAY